VRLPTGRRVEGEAKQIFSTKKKLSALKNFKIFSQIESKSIKMFFKVYNFLGPVILIPPPGAQNKT